MLLGSGATYLGFLVHEGLLSHPEFDQQWQTQTISYLYEYQKKQKNTGFSRPSISGKTSAKKKYHGTKCYPCACP
jgi:hypothetical protein